VITPDDTTAQNEADNDRESRVRPGLLRTYIMSATKALVGPAHIKRGSSVRSSPPPVEGPWTHLPTISK
jgi:hypothetical protein